MRVIDYNYYYYYKCFEKEAKPEHLGLYKRCESKIKEIMKAENYNYNVIKISKDNTISFLNYPGFTTAFIPTLKQCLKFYPDKEGDESHKVYTYDDNPPILHEKERIVSLEMLENEPHWNSCKEFSRFLKSKNLLGRKDVKNIEQWNKLLIEKLNAKEIQELKNKYNYNIKTEARLIDRQKRISML